MRLLCLMLLAFLLLATCTQARPETVLVAPATATPDGTPTPQPTATLPPTAVPGTGADRREAAAVVAQFGDALVHGDELVALLVLSPSAQKVVAATSLEGLLGRPARPQDVTVGTIQLQDDVALADLVLRYPTGETLVRLQLVRLDGQWRIDGRAD